VEWLGQHPDIEDIVGRKLPLHTWKTQPYVPSPVPLGTVPGRSRAAREALQLLLDGNNRFLEGRPGKKQINLNASPSAIILGGAECRVPIEDLFDVEPGRTIVQRVVGSIAGTQERTAFASMEYAILKWKPQVLVVLMESNSPIIEAALTQLRGDFQPRAPIKVVLDQLMVSALRAVQQVQRLEGGLTAAGRDLKTRQLATELSAFYSIELLLNSKRIRDQVDAGLLELHAAVTDSTTGRVRFLGEHPMQEKMMQACSIFETLDSDGDGIISRDEWQSAFASLT